MLSNNRHKTYSSVSFDGETVSKTATAEAETKTVAPAAEDAVDTGVDTKSVSEETERGQETQKPEGNSIVKAVKSREDQENERKIKKILGLEGRHKLEYSDLLSSFVILFDNFCRMRDEYARFKKKMAVHERLSAYGGQHGFAPTWN